MRAAGRKLKSERGASILMALLLLLICLMVGASLLMAAASNVGKTRSNRQEHQAYLALSSALRMLTDDLTDAEYYGQFIYHKTETTNSEGAVVKTEIAYEQTDGKMECGMENLIRPQLDALFAAYIEKERDKEAADPASHTTYRPLDSALSAPAELRLTVTPDIVSSDEKLKALKGFETEVEVEINNSYGMELTAGFAKLPEEYGENALDQYKDYKLIAELTPMESAPKVNNDGESFTDGQLYQSTPMKWSLKWIIRPQDEEKS